SQADALRLAKLAAASQSRIVEGAHQLLGTLAQVPQSLIGGSSCDRLLAEVLSGQTLYANLGVADLSGDVYCSALPISNPVNISDRAYFQRALAGGGFAIGDYQIGRVTGLPTLNFGHVVQDVSGAVRAVVFAAFDLAYFNELPSDLELPPGATLSVVDSQGTILARYPDPGAWTGESLPESWPLDRMLDEGEGSLEVSGLDGVARVYGFTRLRGAATSSPVFVRVGIPTSLAYEESNRQLIQSLGAMGLVAAIALSALWVGSELFILRGTRALLAATRRLAAGDLSARSGLPESGGEVGELAQAFDQMAASLAERQAALVRAESQYRALVEHIPSAIYTMELGENPTGTYVSPQILDLTGRTPGEWLADPYTWLNEIVADDRQAVLDEYMSAYRAGTPFRAEYRVARADGEIVWVRDQAAIVTRPGGGRYLLGVLNDVTDRKRAEDALRGSEERYRKLVEQLPAIVYVYDHTTEH
ncbi:MAG: PAS domain S-box protein, partial [Anaerolineales bacterium]